MKASRMSVAVAGALLAVGMGSLTSSGAIAGMRGPGGTGFSFHGAAPRRIGGLHAPFNPAAAFDRRPMRRRRGGEGFDSFDGTGAFPDEAPQDAQGAPPVQVMAYFAPAAPATEAPGWAPARSGGPKIIEIGRRAPRRVHWPVVVYGDR